MDAISIRTLARRRTCVLVALACVGAAECVAGMPVPSIAPYALHNVEVTSLDPATFTEVQRYPREGTGWLDDLTRYIAQRAVRTLPADQRLTVTITDVQLAGRFEPWRPGPLGNARIVRDRTPPRITLSFRLESAQGTLVKQGVRDLHDVNFMIRSSLYHRGQPLAHEKTLIDDWLRNELGRSGR